VLRSPATITTKIGFMLAPDGRRGTPRAMAAACGSMTCGSMAWSSTAWRAKRRAR